MAAVKTTSGFGGPWTRERRDLYREPVRLLQPQGVEARGQLPSKLLGGLTPLVGEPLLGQLGLLTDDSDGQGHEYARWHEHRRKKQEHAAPASGQIRPTHRAILGWAAGGHLSRNCHAWNPRRMARPITASRRRR